MAMSAGPYVAVEVDVTQALAHLHGLASRVGGGLGEDWAGPAVSMEIAAIEREWFQTEGRGSWAPLAPRTVYMRKHRQGTYARTPAGNVGDSHPVLQWTGDLKAALGDPRGAGRPYAIVRMTPMLLEQGTTLPYAIFHESREPRTRLPRRAVIAAGDWVAERLAAVWKTYVLAEAYPVGKPAAGLA